MPTAQRFITIQAGGLLRGQIALSLQAVVVIRPGALDYVSAKCISLSARIKSASGSGLSTANDSACGAPAGFGTGRRRWGAYAGP